MTRKNCKQPDACIASSRGPCRLCSDMTAHAERSAERMRKMNADPEFAAANAERMRKRHAEKLHTSGVPVGAEDIYRLARRKGFSKKEAVRIAKQSRPTREAAE